MISEKKFIELLNLYLDHEISAEQVRVLEAEIRRDPARHTLYRQYCAMHRGCLELGRAFAPQHESAPEIALPPRPSRPTAAREFAQTLRPAGFGWGAWASGVGLAAACGALAFFVFSNHDRSSHSPDAVVRAEWAEGQERAEREGRLASAPEPSVAPASAPRSVVAIHAAEGHATGRASFANGRAAVHHVPAAPASSAIFANTASASAPTLPPLAAPVAVAVKPAAATSALALYRLHPVYSPGFPRSHAEVTRGHPFSYIAASSQADDAEAHLEREPLANIDAIRTRARPQGPLFQVQPARAPHSLMYRRQESPPETEPHAVPLRFQFQR